METLQPPRHPFHRGIEEAILPYAAEHDIGVLVYGPLAHGLLSGTTDSTVFDADDQLVDELATDADIVDEAGALALSAHTLRHTLATNLLRAGVDIAIVAELLGHARLDTTRRYTLPTHTDLEDDVSHLPTDQSGHR